MDDYNNWRGKTVLDKDGNKIGTLSELYVDDDTNRPKFATVQTGLFGTKQNFFPVPLARVRDDTIVLDASEDQVRNAPQIDADQELEAAQERELYQYYGLARDNAEDDNNQLTDGDSTQEDTEDTEDKSAAPTSPSEDTTDEQSTEEAAIRSERHLHISTEKDADGRVRLKKYVITENIIRNDSESDEEEGQGEVRKERVDSEGDGDLDTNRR